MTLNSSSELSGRGVLGALKDFIQLAPAPFQASFSPSSSLSRCLPPPSPPRHCARPPLLQGQGLS